VLKDFSLYIFPSENPKAKVVEIIEMPGYRVITAPPPNDAFNFKLVHPSNKEYHSAAKDQEYFEVWIEALTHAAISQFSKKINWTEQKLSI